MNGSATDVNCLKHCCRHVHTSVEDLLENNSLFANQIQRDSGKLSHRIEFLSCLLGILPPADTAQDSSDVGTDKGH